VVEVLYKAFEDHEREAIEEIEENDADPESLILVFGEEGGEGNHERDHKSHE